MCRSIKKLRLPQGTAGRDEIEAAALQFVRKVSGFRSPSRVNAPAFEGAVAEISDATERLLGALQSPTPRRTGAEPAAPSGTR